MAVILSIDDKDVAWLAATLQREAERCARAAQDDAIYGRAGEAKHKHERSKRVGDYASCLRRAFD